MKMKHLILPLAAVLSLAGCNNGNGPNDSTPPPPVPGSMPLVSLVNQMFASTSETATPVEINALRLDTTSEDATAYDGLII